MRSDKATEYFSPALPASTVSSLMTDKYGPRNEAITGQCARI